MRKPTTNHLVFNMEYIAMQAIASSKLTGANEGEVIFKCNIPTDMPVQLFTIDTTEIEDINTHIKDGYFDDFDVIGVYLTKTNGQWRWVLTLLALNLLK